jgi:hypothetical protein
MLGCQVEARVSARAQSRMGVSTTALTDRRSRPAPQRGQPPLVARIRGLVLRFTELLQCVPSARRSDFFAQLSALAQRRRKAGIEAWLLTGAAHGPRVAVGPVRCGEMARSRPR